MPSMTHCGHTLTWEEHGQGDHTLIFIHGYSANRASWTSEVTRMARYGRCVSLDLPGHYPATTPSGYRDLSQDLLLDMELRAITAIAAGGKVTLVGHSTGGLVALAAAAMLPETVVRVIALSPVVWGPLTGVLGRFHRLLAIPGGYGFYWLNYLGTQISLPYIQWCVGQYYSGDPAAYRRNVVAATAAKIWHPDYRHARIRNFAILLCMLEHCDIRPLAPRISCPALVISGTRDPVVPITQARWLAAHSAGVTLYEVPTAGHIAHWEAPEQVHQCIDRWLEAHPL